MSTDRRKADRRTSKAKWWRWTVLGGRRLTDVFPAVDKGLANRRAPTEEQDDD